MPKRMIPQSIVENGVIAAIGAAVAALLALAITTVRRAFTNEEAVVRIEKAITDRIDQWERQRQEDRREVREELKRLHERVDELHSRNARMDK